MGKLIETFDYALDNLRGCVQKMDDARATRYGMTYERAVRDSHEVLKGYTERLAKLRPVLEAALDKGVVCQHLETGGCPFCDVSPGLCPWAEGGRCTCSTTTL